MPPEVTSQAIDAITRGAGDGEPWAIILLGMAAGAYFVITITDKVWYHVNRVKERRNGNGDASANGTEAPSTEATEGHLEKMADSLEELARLQRDQASILSEIHGHTIVIKDRTSRA